MKLEINRIYPPNFTRHQKCVVYTKNGEILTKNYKYYKAKAKCSVSSAELPPTNWLLFKHLIFPRNFITDESVMNENKIFKSTE